MQTTLCETCGQAYGVGQWYRCPHERAAFVTIPDDVPGGFWAENGFPEPRFFTSHSAHEAALAADGKEIAAKYAGEHDRYLTNWAAGMDAGTLENARVLVSRGTVSRENRKAELARICAEFPVTVTPLSEITR